MPRNLILILAFILLIPLKAQAHETIYFSIHQVGFDGQAALTMVGPREFKNQKTVLIIFKAHGSNFSDEEDIYVDPASYKPFFVQRDFNLGIFGQGQTLEEYLPAKGEIVITKKDGSKTSQQIINKQGEIDNIYGFIYRYRKEGSFKIGDEIKMSLPTQDLVIKLLRQESFKIDQKTYDSYYMESQPTRYKIWFDASKHKLPLRITGTIGILNSVMTMTGYKE